MTTADHQPDPPRPEHVAPPGASALAGRLEVETVEFAVWCVSLCPWNTYWIDHTGEVHLVGQA